MNVKFNNVIKSNSARPSVFQEFERRVLLLDEMYLDRKSTDAIKEYLIDLKIENKTIKTLRYKQDNLGDFLKYAQVNNFPEILKELTITHLRQYLNDRTAYVWSLRAKYLCLKAFYNWAIRQHYVLDNPLDNIKIAKMPDKIISTISMDNVKVLLGRCDDSFLGKRNKAIMLVLLDSGVRLSELCSLKLEDVDIENGLLQIQKGKGNKGRIVKIGDKTRRELWQYIKARNSLLEQLFLSEERRPLKPSGIQIMLRRMEQQTGIDCNPHRWRHTFAISFLRNGGDISMLKTLLGHASLTIVMNYLKTINSDDAIRAHQKFSPVDRL